MQTKQQELQLPTIAQEARGSLVDLRVGNKLEMIAGEAHECGKRCTQRTDNGAWQTGVRPHRWMRIGQVNWKQCARRRATFEVVGE